MERKNVDSKEVARKLIRIAAAGYFAASASYLSGCHTRPEHFEKLTQQDRQELAKLLNSER